jgi:hypothetical protein
VLWCKSATEGQWKRRSLLAQYKLFTRKWQWCVKTRVKIQGLKFTEADAKEVDLLQEALDRVTPHGIVQCSLKMDANTRNVALRF